MRHSIFFFLFLLVCVCTSNNVQAQNHELGLSLGTSNFLGDFGGGHGRGTIFLKDIEPSQFRFSAGAFYRYNFKRFLAVRAQLQYGKLLSDDNLSQEQSRFARGFASSSPILDFTGQFEFNFIPLKLCDPRNSFTPYIAGGVGASYFNPTVTHRSGGNPFNPDEIPDYNDDHSYLVTSNKNLALNIPISFGVKYNIKYNWIVGLEATHRISLTDELDRYVRQQNDQYFFILANVSYVFCGNGRGGGRSLCPTYSDYKRR